MKEAFAVEMRYKPERALTQDLFGVKDATIQCRRNEV